MNARLVIISLLCVLTFLRWGWNTPREISPDEAYLALCGFTPDVAYFDGPPGVAIAVATGIRIAGTNGLGASLLWPMFAFAATLALYQLVAPVSGQRAALASAVLLNLLPAFNQSALSPSCVMPLTMFGLAFMACTWRAIETESTIWWVAAGLGAAGGLLFSFYAWFFLPALGAVFLVSHRWRRLLMSAGFWMATLPSLLVCALFLSWNAQHGWVHFIGGTWQTALTLDWSQLPISIVKASISLSPFVFLALQTGLLLSLREIRHAPKAKFLAVPSVLALLIATYQILRGESALAPGMLAAAFSTALLAWLPANFGNIPTRHALNIVFASAAVWTASALALQTTSPPLVSAKVGKAIQTIQTEQQTDQPLFLIAENAPLASALALHLTDLSAVHPGHPPVYVVESPYADSQYALWARYDQFVDAPAPSSDTVPDPFTEQKGVNPFIGSSALYITTQSPDDLPQAVTAAFGSYRHLADIKTPSGKILRLFLCTDYETLPL